MGYLYLFDSKKLKKIDGGYKKWGRQKLGKQVNIKVHFYIIVSYMLTIPDIVRHLVARADSGSRSAGVVPAKTELLPKRSLNHTVHYHSQWRPIHYPSAVLRATNIVSTCYIIFELD